MRVSSLCRPPFCEKVFGGQTSAQHHYHQPGSKWVLSVFFVWEREEQSLCVCEEEDKEEEEEEDLRFLTKHTHKKKGKKEQRTNTQKKKKRKEKRKPYALERDCI